MVKTIILLFLGVNSLFATNYNFTEIRYSDALDKEISFNGNISFNKDALHIKYLKENKSLDYSNDSLVYKEDNKEITLDNIQAQKIIQYFKILILVHDSNDNEIKNIFKITKKDSKTILLPKTSLSNYIKKVELLKYEDEIKQIQLFLQNDDYIKINIHDEI